MELSHIKNSIIRAFHPIYLRKRFLRWALSGDNVECPCCGAQFVTFLPAGLEKRPNALCLKCGSLERHRVLWLFLKEKGLLGNIDMRLMHVAPEKILYTLFSSKTNCQYYPIDLNPSKYDYGLKTRKMDVTSLTYEDNFFDAVICNHVLEHVPDDAKALSEMCRVLKPEGWAILNVPINDAQEITREDPSITDPVKMRELFGQPDHVRIYGKDYLLRLANAGFKVEVINFVAAYPPQIQFKYGLKEKELIFFCTKQ